MESKTDGASQPGFIMHPLPLLNISDYYVRAKLTGNKNHVGILFGTRTERDLAVENAFEVIVEDGKVDQTYMKQRINLYKTTFPEQDAIGWYHIRPDNHELSPDAESLGLHEQMQLQDDLDLSLMMIFNPEVTGQSSQLPIKVFELVFKEKSTEFSEIVGIRVETNDAERIGVDDIIKGQQLTTGQHLDSHLNTQGNAMKMFYDRLKIVQQYVKGVNSGELPPNYPLLRQINAFVSKLSQEREHNLQKVLDQQELNVLSAGLMAAVYKGTAVSADVAAKRQVAAVNEHDEFSKQRQAQQQHQLPQMHNEYVDSMMGGL